MPIKLTALTVAQVEEVIRLYEIGAAKPGRYTGGDLMVIPEKHEEDLERAHLESVIDLLPNDAKCELMALMRLGQGTVGKEYSLWNELLQDAHEELDKDIPLQLSLKGNLSEYLHRGLEMIGC